MGGGKKGGKRIGGHRPKGCKPKPLLIRENRKGKLQKRGGGGRKTKVKRRDSSRATRDAREVRQ